MTQLTIEETENATTNEFNEIIEENYTYPVIPPEPASSLHEDKIYLVTHSGLSAGYQAAQTVHAMADFVMNHPESAKKWHTLSNSIIILEAPDAQALSTLQQKAINRGIVVQEFREPDLGDEITALAFEPGPKVRKLLSNYPLAGKNLHNQKALHDNEHALRTMSFAMMDCEQTKGQNVLQHGRSVREHYFALLEHLEGKRNLNDTTNWVIPEWLDQYAGKILPLLPDRYIMDRYLTLHDCGKPDVREVDEEGRVHFPDHAGASERAYRRAFGEHADETVAFLIANDMQVHMLKAADIPEFAKQHTAVAQLLAALAEVTSNAGMFGGVDSTSFKIKYKQINQRGKALMKILFED